MKYILLIMGVVGLLMPSAGWSKEDMFSVASHPYGASRFTANLFGHNADNDAALETVWDSSDLGGPIRCFTVTGTTAVALYISSDNEADASDNNAVSVTVEALDANWDPVTIVAPLGAASASGTLFVQIGSVTLLRVNRAYVTTAAAAGNIYIHIDSADGGTDGVPDTILTDLVALIQIGDNQTQQACYTVPNNYKGFLTSWCGTNIETAANAITKFEIRSSVEGTASRVHAAQELIDLVDRGPASKCFYHSPPIRFDQKTDIELTSTSDSADAAAEGSFDLLMISNRSSGL